MFKVTKNPTFTHTVKVSVPVDGGFEDQSMKVTYRVIGTAEGKKYDLDTADGSTQLLLATIVKVDDLIDDAKAPVTWNDDVRDQLFDTPYVRRALADGYFAGLRGAKTGN